MPHARVEPGGLFFLRLLLRAAPALFMRLLLGAGATAAALAALAQPAATNVGATAVAAQVLLLAPVVLEVNNLAASPRLAVVAVGG